MSSPLPLRPRGGQALILLAIVLAVAVPLLRDLLRLAYIQYVYWKSGYDLNSFDHVGRVGPLFGGKGEDPKD